MGRTFLNCSRGDQGLLRGVVRWQAGSNAKPKQVTAISPTFLERVALSYLNRFDATRAKLADVLKRRASKVNASAAPEDQVSEEQILEWINALLDRYGESNLIDDRRFAEVSAQNLRARGGSRRAIAMRLVGKGVASDVVRQAIDNVDAGGQDPELEAALRLVRRKRLGPHRDAATRRDRFQKDLASLARAGFSYDVARRALE